jgi:starch phosphorylase
MQIHEQWLHNIEKRLARNYFKTIKEATQAELQYVVTREVFDSVLDNWDKTKHTWWQKKAKMAYYLSAEFLMGRWLGNAMINIGGKESIDQALNSLNLDSNVLEDASSDAGLGNGGLGRLAACFLDSLATLDYPAFGYGIRYRYGMFEQKIEHFEQTEKPDQWLANGDPYSIRRTDRSVWVKMGGQVVVEHDQYQWVNTEDVWAVPYDMPIIGYKTNTVGTLRLWQAEAPDGFDLSLFQDEHYQRAVEKQNRIEDISRVLYPNDRGASGKTLRLKQQYFFVSASLQDILRRYKNTWGNDFSHLPDAIAIQMNDTHPVLAIPELMRLLMDVEHLPWESAWENTIRCCAYTNHTIMAEALEKWPIDIFATLLPRHYQIVEEINRRFLVFLRQMYPGDWERHTKMSIISNGVVNMAWLAIVGSHSVNGVAALHTDLLKTRELKHWYDIFPEKFNNKTNGVTQRRWLLKANPRLSSWITEKIGDSWITNMSDIEKLMPLAQDENALREFMQIKQKNKQDFSAFVQAQYGINIDPHSLFDVQVKRLHEYKRQLLNVLHILYLYKKLKDHPHTDMVPRTFIFGAKAASGYRQAKLIIKLINVISHVVNNDASLQGKLKVIFLENYRVSLAEKIFPASDVSEQISTAGYEASGTGNMKFMMNGALTIGTLDGANVEIVDATGHENAFIFGLKANEVAELQPRYNVQELINRDIELASVLDLLLQPPFAIDGPDTFREIYNSLVYGIQGNRADHYLVLADFRSYLEAQARVEHTYRNKQLWAKMALINVAKSGIFSSDRTINQYAKEIWHLNTCKIH